MNDYCVDLKLDIPILNDNFQLPKKRHSKHTVDIIQSQVIDYFDQKNLFISLVEIFYSPPYYKSKIHIDGIPGDYTKINFIYGGTDGIMSWYKSKIEKATSRNNIGLIDTKFQNNEVSHLFSKTIDIALLQVGVPHSVKNFQDERWAVCLVYRDKKTERRITMKESKEIFKDIIKNDDDRK